MPSIHTRLLRRPAVAAQGSFTGKCRCAGPAGHCRAVVLVPRHAPPACWRWLTPGSPGTCAVDSLPASPSGAPKPRCLSSPRGRCCHTPRPCCCTCCSHTGIIESSFVPLALGIAESAALAGLMYGNAPTALACIALFHAARLLPLLPLGALYLARYKLCFLDLLDGASSTAWCRPRRPAHGWRYSASDAPDAPRLRIIIPAYNEAERCQVTCLRDTRRARPDEPRRRGCW